ncbi:MULTISPECIES: glutathione S-transferase family protein [unclassified Sphingomonas]|uniref:glutathione S-transferase family protein n=1 Tax=unclassified Sphingomonas TaxID=196159 RepID=UPI0006F8B95A|nr:MULTISPECIES: glutathione S-transferase family protein [unclassified Sphingomonas]KQN14371.1 glutathione S-transferase [Sphingomonas sp. Leaf30]MBD8552353.1 glutathione S-transferase family protein [Sphingomonas sp. CFBP 8764]
MTLTLYSNPMSRGRIARWMLEETGAAYDTVMLDYATTMKEAPYLSVNPMGKVPAIVHNGNVVTECAAICAYLADAVPEAQLAPTADERADYYRWLFYAAGPLEAAITNRSLGVVPTETQQRMVGYGSFEAAIAGLEHAVASHSYIAGERFTAADVYVGAQVIWGLQFGTMPKLAAFEAYAARLTERAAYRRAATLDDDAMAKMAS